MTDNYAVNALVWCIVAWIWCVA